MSRIERLTESAGRFACLVGAGLAQWAGSPAAVEGAQRREQALVRGYQLGLTDEQTREVIGSWTTRVGGLTDWDMVDAALVRRALRQGKWQP